MTRARIVPWSHRCKNPRCDDFYFGGRLVVLCPSCRLAGSWGIALAALIGFVLKLSGLL